MARTAWMPPVGARDGTPAVPAPRRTHTPHLGPRVSSRREEAIARGGRPPADTRGLDTTRLHPERATCNGGHCRHGRSLRTRICAAGPIIRCFELAPDGRYGRRALACGTSPGSPVVTDSDGGETRDSSPHLRRDGATGPEPATSGVTCRRPYRIYSPESERCGFGRVRGSRALWPTWREPRAGAGLL